jgi:hypothetical protein
VALKLMHWCYQVANCVLHSMTNALTCVYHWCLLCCSWVVLDGAERLTPDALSTLQRLLHDGEVSLCLSIYSSIYYQVLI